MELCREWQGLQLPEVQTVKVLGVQGSEADPNDFQILHQFMQKTPKPVYSKRSHLKDFGVMLRDIFGINENTDSSETDPLTSNITSICSKYRTHVQW